MNRTLTTHGKAIIGFIGSAIIMAFGTTLVPNHPINTAICAPVWGASIFVIAIVTTIRDQRKENDLTRSIANNWQAVIGFVFGGIIALTGHLLENLPIICAGLITLVITLTIHTKNTKKLAK